MEVRQLTPPCTQDTAARTKQAGAVCNSTQGCTDLPVIQEATSFQAVLFRALLWETFCSGRDDLPLHCGRGATSHVCLVGLAWNVASVTEEWNLSFYLLLTNLGDHLNALM